jgi:CRISPR/Cas system-associated exonuclease Cas4 (RecB family)
MIKLPDLPTALETGLRSEEDLRDNSILHVSDLSATIPGEGCPRQLWLSIRGAEKRELSPGQMLMFWHGKRIHEDLIPLLTAGLVDTEWEIYRVEQPLRYKDIVGTTDVILRNKKDGTFIIGDFKSMRGRGFQYLDPDNAKPAHVLQVQTYMYLSEVSAVCEPVMGLVFYVDREGQNAFQQRVIVRDDAAVRGAIAEAKDIIAMSEAPPILTAKIKTGKDTKTKGTPVNVSMPWNCDYCDFRDVSCPGALSQEHRNMGVVGHIVADGFVPTKDLPDEVFSQIIDELVDILPF